MRLLVAVALACALLATPFGSATIYIASGQQCGGLGGNCAQANGTGGACYNGLWGGYSCTAGYNCTSDTDYWWSCKLIPPGSDPSKPLPSSCSDALRAASPNTTTQWIDGDTPNTACTMPICRQDFASCNLPSFLQPLDDMVLVFSDEFQDSERDFSSWCDSKWHALDLNYYVNGDVAGFKPEAVTVQNGKLVITTTREDTTSSAALLDGEKTVTTPYKSGMVQGWNKFCYTGGYLEVRAKLPGGTDNTGLWPAVFMMGNLGRAGFLNSTLNLWPYSYDICDAAATSKLAWSDLEGQLMNRCNNGKGRGATEIDLFEVGVWNLGQPLASTSVQLAPLLPPYSHWLNFSGGMYFPTGWDAAKSKFYSRPNDWVGANSWPGQPRPGTLYQDAISATHNLDDTFYTDFHNWGIDWKPDAYVRWYIDGVMVFEANKLAFQGATNAWNQTCGDRLIPNEPSYIIMDVAMSNEFTVVDPAIPLPASMEIEYVRLYQSKSSINIGCDPPGYPTTDYIQRNINKYMLPSKPDAFVCYPKKKPVDYTLLAILLPVLLVSLIGISVAGWYGIKWWQKRQQALEDEAAATGPRKHIQAMSIVPNSGPAVGDAAADKQSMMGTMRRGNAVVPMPGAVKPVLPLVA